MELDILMKMAITNREAAWSAYEKRFGSTVVSFTDRIYRNRTDAGHRINPNNQNIEIDDYDFLEMFLDLFGNLVKVVHVSCYEDSKFKWADVMRVIGIQCNKLQKLHLTNVMDGDFVDYLTQSTTRAKVMARNPWRSLIVFPTLESFDAENIFFDVDLKFNECFPKLRSLDLLTTVTSDPSFIEVNIPTLEHLGITMTGQEDEECDGDDDIDYLRRANIENALKLNPQLKSLYFEIDMDISLIKFINETLPNLEKVDFLFGKDHFENYNGPDVVLKSVKAANFSGQLGKRLPIKFEKLNELDWEMEGADDVALKFIENLTTLTKPQLVASHGDELLSKMVRALPNLQDLHVMIHKKEWPARNLVRFLDQCERIDNFHLMVEVSSNGQSSWRNDVSPMWKIKTEFTANNFIITKGDYSE